MSETQTPGMPQEAQTADGAAACGAILREARQAAGLSIDAIAQQLKLAPRQVHALESGQFELLPGRTFVRGFLRNYARALHLDPEKVLASLPEPARGETLQPTSGNMGEIRFESAPRRPWARWAIPLALIALVAFAAVYEYLRPGREMPGTIEPRSATTSAPAPAATPANTTPAPAAPSEPAGKPLPNPLASGDGEAAKSAAQPAAPAADLTPAAGGVVSTAIPPVRPGEPTLVIVFSGASWTEVKDSTGKVLLSLTGSPGMTQSVSGAPPLEVIVGNVAHVSMTFRGAPVDLSPYARANIARMRLP